MSQGIEILCDSHHGVFIPQLMINRLIDNGWRGLNHDAPCVLSDPINEWYWEEWESVIDNAWFLDENGKTWYLHHDGDLFAYCYDLMTEEEKENFFEY